MHRACPTASCRSRPQSARPSRCTKDSADPTEHLVSTARLPATGKRGGITGGSGGVDSIAVENNETGRDRPGPVDRQRGPPFVPPPPFSRRVDGMTSETTGAGSGTYCIKSDNLILRCFLSKSPSGKLLPLRWKGTLRKSSVWSLGSRHTYRYTSLAPNPN